MVFLCIDVGGTNTLLGVGGKRIHTVRKQRTPAFLDRVENEVDAVIDAAGHDRDAVEQVAVAVAGAVHPDKQMFTPPNMDEDIGFDRFRFGDDLTVINDCTAAAVGEHIYGDHATDNLVYLTISTGIGAGVIADGRLLQGWKGNVGEVGHIVVGDDGVRCGCGGTDHWEAYCGGGNIPRLAAERYGVSYDDARELFEAYERGDADAHRIVDYLREYMVNGLTAVVNAFNPEHIAVGGGIGLNHGNILLAGVEERLEDTMVQTPTIRQCSLGEESVLYGLLAACRDDPLIPSRSSSAPAP